MAYAQTLYYGAVAVATVLCVFVGMYRKVFAPYLMSLSEQLDLDPPHTITPYL